MPSIMRRINVISRCQALFKSERLSGEVSSCHQLFFPCISRNPGMSQDDIAKYLCLNKSTVARSLASLEENGFVMREADAEDKRVMRVYPSEKMLSLTPHIKEALKEWNAYISEGISEEEMAVFSSVLEKMEARARERVFPGDKK